MIKKIILNLINKFGYSIEKYKDSEPTENIVKLINRYKINLIIDGGANEGQYSKRILGNGYKKNIISFEPIISAHNKLQANAKDFPNWVVGPRCALGNENKEISINVSKNIVSSSILGIRNETIEFAPETEYIRKEKVQLRTLNSYYNEYFKNEDNIFLKLDVQGFEKMVLEGASEILPLVKGIQLETSLFRLYDNEPIIEEMITYVKGLGYELFDLSPGYRNSSTNRLTQVDCIFIRK